MGVAPHPHIGLQTLTWLLEGEALHRDSLDTEQVIRTGQLNLMTAGHGIAHSEEGTDTYRGTLRHRAPRRRPLAAKGHDDSATSTRRRARARHDLMVNAINTIAHLAGIEPVSPRATPPGS